MKKWLDPIAELTPCPEALQWADTHPDLKTAWANCENGAWMLWLLGKFFGPAESDSRRNLVLAACACARLALPYVQAGDKRPLIAIEAAEKKED